jgi:hypothetical protein
MKLNELRKVIREEVKAAIQEELKDILLEAVRSPKGAITETVTSPSKPQVDPAAQQAARQSIMQSMMNAGGNPMMTTKDVNTFNPQGAMPGGDLPAGNVGLDQIMGLMNGK